MFTVIILYILPVIFTKVCFIYLFSSVYKMGFVSVCYCTCHYHDWGTSKVFKLSCCAKMYKLYTHKTNAILSQISIRIFCRSGFFFLVPCIVNVINKYTNTFAYVCYLTEMKTKTKFSCWHNNNIVFNILHILYSCSLSLECQHTFVSISKIQNEAVNVGNHYAMNSLHCYLFIWMHYSPFSPTSLRQFHLFAIRFFHMFQRIDMKQYLQLYLPAQSLLTSAGPTEIWADRRNLLKLIYWLMHILQLKYS